MSLFPRVQIRALFHQADAVQEPYLPSGRIVLVDTVTSLLRVDAWAPSLPDWTCGRPWQSRSQSGCVLLSRISGGALLLYGSVIRIGRHRGCGPIRRRVGGRLGIRSLHGAVVIPGCSGRVCSRDGRHHRWVWSIIFFGSRGFRDVSGRRTTD